MTFGADFVCFNWVELSPSSVSDLILDFFFSSSHSWQSCVTVWTQFKPKGETRPLWYSLEKTKHNHLIHKLMSRCFKNKNGVKEVK